MKHRLLICAALILLAILAAVIFERAWLAAEDPPDEAAAKSEALEIHPPVPDVSPSWADDLGYLFNDTPQDHTVATGTPEAPEETPALEIIAGRVITEVTPLVLESIPLDARTQWSIYELCDSDNSLFAAVMAVANRESYFTPDAIGDDGQSYGMMQINYSLHSERITRLEISDLFDPVQSATVAIDYIKELGSEFGVAEDSHILYVAYNRGSTGARELFDKGIYSTGYSWDVVTLYQKYLAELETHG